MQGEAVGGVLFPEDQMRELLAKGESEMKIPTEIVKALLASVSQLRDENKLLKASVQEANLVLPQRHQVGERTFTKFPELPVEIRKLIWSEFLRFSRVVGLKVSQSLFQNGRDENDRGFGSRASGTLCPLLRTNKEARDAAFEVQSLLHSELDSLAPRVIMNLEIDVLWLINLDTPGLYAKEPSWVGEIQRRPKDQHQNFRSIAVYWKCWEGNVHPSQAREAVSCLMANIKSYDVKEINVVVGGWEVQNSADIRLIEPRLCTCSERL